jgi:hypothetical protein
MNKLIVLLPLIILSAGLVFGQDVSFDYDADGNMEFRYVVELRSSAQSTEEEETTGVVTSEIPNGKIVIYPNPTKGKITIDITPIVPEEKNLLQLYDMNGKLLENREMKESQTDLEINGPPGTYLLNIYRGETVSKWKIIKQ